MYCNLNSAYDYFQFKSDPTAYSYANLNQIRSTQGLKNALVYPHFSGHAENCLVVAECHTLSSFYPSPVVRGRAGSGTQMMAVFSTLVYCPCSCYRSLPVSFSGRRENRLPFTSLKSILSRWRKKASLLEETDDFLSQQLYMLLGKKT